MDNVQKVDEFMIFDAHGDILTDIYEEDLKGHKDSFITKHYPLYQKAKITSSIFVNWTDPQKDSQVFNRIFDVGIKSLHEMDDIIKVCYTHDDLLQAEKEDKLGIIIGVEGLKYLKEVEDIKSLYQRGLRHAIITWNEQNDYASGALIEDGGLTEKGKLLIKTMEALGMIIDLSHANPKTFNDIMEVTHHPVIVSHGNAKALCDHKRNYTDEQLMMIKEKNGVIGVCGIANFISNEVENHTVEFMAKHIDYIVKLIGIDYVGLGLDVCYYLYEGRTSTNVKGFETIGELSNLFDELKKLGYQKEDIDKIKYKNFFRVIKEILG
jgi:membrane dipeptidase